MAPELYSIWKGDELILPWRLQLQGYVAFFETESGAKKFADAVRKVRERESKPCQK